MPELDNAIEDLGDRFGLGPKAGALLREVVQLITDTPGGIGGFIGKFRSAGLGSQVASWLGRTDGAALTAAQVERALGSSTLDGIAGRLGLGGSVVGTAIGYALPKVIGQMTPGGTIPSSLPSWVSRFSEHTIVQEWERQIAIVEAQRDQAQRDLVEAQRVLVLRFEDRLRDLDMPLNGESAVLASSLADIDAILDRLDKGIAAERAAMDRLIERMVSRTP